MIGHEITHQFDDQGRTTDADGVRRDWWTPADAAAFKARADVLGAQYAQFEPLPGMHKRCRCRGAGAGSCLLTPAGASKDKIRPR